MAEDEAEAQRAFAVRLASTVGEQDRGLIVAWFRGLLDIRNSSLPVLQKAKDAIALTARSKVVWPIAKTVGREVKRHAWDERGLKGRLGIAGVTAGIVAFGGQSAGIAALGTAIGVPLWVVLGAGATFAGYVIEELTGKGQATAKTTYRVIEAEREENDKS